MAIVCAYWIALALASRRRAASASIINSPRRTLASRAMTAESEATRSECVEIGVRRDPLKRLHRIDHMLHGRRLGEAMADELAPLLEVRRGAEVDGVVLQCLPLHEQPVAVRFLDRALELHAMAAFGALEDRSRLLDAVLERVLAARLYVDPGDFHDHAVPLSP